eukprot:gb/GECG01011906.1/.p1 GENE.gb/GECG01011906.1/~~gb/GECG01011906.1/.p1  ORF type:complete len:124 (+),score=13.82 gb/GECG01011906.1/:1-372(+)
MYHSPLTQYSPFTFLLQKFFSMRSSFFGPSSILPSNGCGSFTVEIGVGFFNILSRFVVVLHEMESRKQQLSYRMYALLTLKTGSVLSFEDGGSQHGRLLASSLPSLRFLFLFLEKESDKKRRI